MKITFRKSNLHLAIIVVIVLLLIPVQVLAATPAQTGQAGLTPEALSSAAAIVLSLIFAYVPKVNTWYESLGDQPQGGAYKRLIMLGLLVIVAGGAYGLSCAGVLSTLFGVAVVCGSEGLLGLIRSLIFALMANQATFLIAPKSPAVQRMKANRSG